MKTNLYNNDGTLSAQAQSLLSPKPVDMSIAERRKSFKEFKSQLSEEDAKEFARIRINAKSKAYQHETKEKRSAHTRAYSKSYYQQNKEEISAYYKAYHQKTKEKRNAQQKAYYEANKEKLKSDNQSRYEATKEEKKAKSRIYYRSNKEKIKANNKAYRAKNKKRLNVNKSKLYCKEKGKVYNKVYRTKNKEKLKVLEAKKRKTPRYKLRKAVTAAFERIKQNKPANTLTLLGCTWEEAKAHIESLWLEGMTWENHGRFGWHIDHIRPVSSFKEDELHLINRIENLQPLWAEDNLSKSNKY
jgi:hypothetical protein